MNGLHTIRRINKSKPDSDNVVNLPTPEPEPDLEEDPPPEIAINCIDEILSYADPNWKEPEPGEIDPYLLMCEFEDYPSSVPPLVFAALKHYVDHGCDNPLQHIPSTTPGYIQIKNYLKAFLLVDREYPPGWSDN